jgi:hypothetical protein
MWHLLQGTIIVIVFAQLYPEKTHNPVAASIVGARLLSSSPGSCYGSRASRAGCAGGSR